MAETKSKTKPTSTADAKSKLSPFETEMIETIKQINTYKEACEANIVSILYKKPDEIYESNLKLEDFSNNIWKVFWNIANDIIIVEKKNTLDDITIGLYLEKHNKLRGMYEKYGGYETILNAGSYVKVENLDGYINELKKWNAVVKLTKLGFPIKDKLSEYVDSSAEEIYNELEALLNHTFVNVDSDVKTYNACDGLDEYVDELDNGSSKGMPMSNCHILNETIGGINFDGNIYGLGANSGVGKSTTAINYLVPSVIEADEKMVIMINEEDQKKVQRELLVWVANNVFKKELHKYVIRNGHFTPEVMELLRQCAKWLADKKEKRNITIIPLEKYSVKIAIKIIKKFSAMGVRLFVLDTLKESFDSRDNDTWKSMERDMVDLYDVVKPSAKNVGLFVTYQLGKASVKLRYLTNNEIGQAKNILDVMSVNLMMRKPFVDEFKGGNREVTCYELIGNSRIPFQLDPKKHYMFTFVPKNRFGATDEYQIVSEYNLSTNVHKDIGICNITQDW